MIPHSRILLGCTSFLLAACALTKGPKFDPRADYGPIDPAFTSSGEHQTMPEKYLQEPTDAFKLGPGDKLDIEILGETGSRAETFVTPDGKIYFNLLPGLDVNGISTTELKSQLEEKLAQFYKHPQVSVNLVDAASKRVWVLGRLNQPGIYPLKRPLRVMDAIAMAGGLFTSRFTGTTEELADLQHSFLVRKGETLPVDFQKLIRDGDLSQNIYLQADDFIYLPSSLTNEVYVLGAVLESRPIGFMNEMNLVGALSRGLGLRPDADLTRVSIIRGSLTDPKIATVDARKVINGKATNFRLQPGDIVYVPGKGQISASEMGREAVNTFVRVVAANEGGHAVVGSGAPNVGINVNVGGSN